MNVIVVGRTPTYWAQVTDGVVVHIAVVDKEPAQYGLANTDVMERRREQHPESVFVHLDGIEPRPGLGWHYDSTTKDFSPPTDDLSPREAATPRERSERSGLSKDSFDAIVSAVRAELMAELANKEK